MKLRFKEQRYRKVFGFQCDFGLIAFVCRLARQNGIMISSMAEHIIQIGLAWVVTEMKDPESRIRLEEHLRRDHAMGTQLNHRNRFDLEVLQWYKPGDQGSSDANDPAGELIAWCRKWEISYAQLRTIAIRLATEEENEQTDDLTDE